MSLFEGIQPTGNVHMFAPRQNEMACRNYPKRAMRNARVGNTFEDHETRTVRLMVNPRLFVLLGMMVFASICSSSTLPRLPRLVEQEDKPLRSVAAEPVSRNSVAAAHGPRSKAARLQTTGGLKPTSSDVKTTKGLDRKPPQTASSLAGCKDRAPVDGHQPFSGKRVLHEQSTATQTKEKSLCNPGSPRSR